MPFSASAACGLARAALACAVLFTGAPVAVFAQALPVHQIVTEDGNETRHSYSVRIEQRLAEADIVRLATDIQRKGKAKPAKVFVNFFLPGAPLGETAWASVVFNPAPKLVIHGLKREDEQALVAEHRIDTRPLLGSWLTSPPAVPGRLTIFSDAGKIYAEWRLRNGQKTLDEVKDSSSSGTRRFDLPDGGHYNLTRSGDLEIWSGSTKIAIGERIRAEPIVAGASVGRTAQASVSDVTAPPLAAGQRASVAATTKTPAPSQPVASAPESGPVAELPPNTRPVPAVDGDRSGEPARAAGNRRTARTKAVTPRVEQSAADATNHHPRRSKVVTTGDQIAAKIAGAL